MSEAAERVYCSQLAQHAGATLIGTAEHVDVWLLLEYDASWRARALDDNELPAVANAWLAAASDAIEAHAGRSVRVQFIRQPGRRGLARQLLIVQAGESQRAVQQFLLRDYDDLADIDVIAALTARTHLIDVPIYLVCTNGQRDLCCARFGMPVFEHLSARYGDCVWQTTHVGGHRYAPNLLCLPEGLLYGFATPVVAEQIVEATRHGEVDLAHLRGRGCYRAVVQAAEHAVRFRSGVSFIDGVRLTGDRKLSDDRWQLTFEVAGRGRMVVTVRAGEPVAVQASCGDGKTKLIDQYVVEAA